MTEKLQQTIKDELAQLPKEGQDAINTVAWITITEEIGKKYLLEEGGINNFQLETLLVLIGVTDPEFYAINIENQVGAIKDDAVKIAEEAFKKIFTPIRKKLEENIKNSGKDKNAKWNQNLDFILSGGDYGSFVERREELSPSPSQGERQRGEVHPSRSDLGRSTPQEGNNPIPQRPRITDINPAVRLSQESSTARVKSKFTI